MAIATVTIFHVAVDELMEEVELARRAICEQIRRRRFLVVAIVY